MKEYCPLSKEIDFARLGKRLNEEDKKAILKSKDTIEFYFTLGMWIRNTWKYGNEEERVEALVKDLSEAIFLDADFLFSALLNGHKKHLRILKKYPRLEATNNYSYVKIEARSYYS